MDEPLVMQATAQQQAEPAFVLLNCWKDAFDHGNTLLYLPRELRDEIYKYVVGSPTEWFSRKYARTTRDRAGHPRYGIPAICQTSRQLRQEALPIFIGAIKLTTSDPLEAYGVFNWIETVMPDREGFRHARYPSVSLWRLAMDEGIRKRNDPNHDLLVLGPNYVPLIGLVEACTGLTRLDVIVELASVVRLRRRQYLSAKERVREEGLADVIECQNLKGLTFIRVDDLALNAGRVYTLKTADKTCTAMATCLSDEFLERGKRVNVEFLIQV